MCLKASKSGFETGDLLCAAYGYSAFWNTALFGLDVKDIVKNSFRDSTQIKPIINSPLAVDNCICVALGFRELLCPRCKTGRDRWLQHRCRDPARARARYGGRARRGSGRNDHGSTSLHTRRSSRYGSSGRGGRNKGRRIRWCGRHGCIRLRVIDTRVGDDGHITETHMMLSSSNHVDIDGAACTSQMYRTDIEAGERGCNCRNNICKLSFFL